MRKPDYLAASVIVGCLLGAGMFSALPSVRAAPSDLERRFQNPPPAALPRTWWHWVSGNVSGAGITADLKAMKSIGLGGFQLFTVDQSAVKGPVKFMSPEWRQFVHQALGEADQLGLEVAIEGCEGWSESGGPWIQPAQGMQQVVWTETDVTGGAPISLTTLPQAPATRGFYRDIALLAFPVRAGDDLPPPDAVTTGDPNAATAALTDRDPATSATLKLTANMPLQITLRYPQPITCRSLTIQGDLALPRSSGTLEASDDGVRFTPVGPITLVGVSSFAPTTGTHFRLTFTGIKAAQVTLGEITLGGARVDQLDARVGMKVTQNLPFTDSSLSRDEVIDPATIVNLTGKTAWNAPPGRWTLLRLGHTGTGATTHPSADPGLECDKMSRAAVQFHLAQMYGPVLADSPAQAGAPRRYILLDSWEAKCANWTPLMPQDFAARRGYDLTPWLPTFAGYVVKDTDSTQRFLWDFRRTIADLVTENHYGTVQQFAHAHNMGVYAEAPGTGLPTVADQLACKGRTDIPMGEFWVSKTAEQNIDDPKETASAAHIYGKPVAATESFTSTAAAASWANDPYGLKALGDREFCLGINRFVFHRYAHQPWLDRAPGMSMGPWGINFERTNTWWNQGSAWIGYLARCQSLLQQGRFVADLLYFYGDGAPVGVTHTNLTPAPPAGFDYDVCNAEILREQMSVKNGLIVLKSGMTYRVLVLPDTDRMTLPVLQKIQALVRAGATVYGPRPQKSPSLSGPSNTDQAIQKIAADMWGDCDGVTTTAHAYGQGRVLWGAPLDAALGSAPDFTASQPGMLFIHRQDSADGADIYFVSHQPKSAQTVDCTFRVSGKIPELWYPDTGRTEPVAFYRSADGRTTVPISFAPVGSVFVVFRRPDTGLDPVVSAQRDGQPLFTAADADTGPGPMDMPTSASPKSLNFLAWGGGAYAFTTRSGRTLAATVDPLPPALALDGPWLLTFPPRLGAPPTASFDRLMSWTDSPDDGVKYFSGTATYRQAVTLPDALFGPGRRLFLDLGAVKNLADVRVNGHALGILWKEPFRVEITDAAKPGTNQIEISVTNLWPNRLIGDQKLPEAQRITWASVQPYTADSPLLPSGLLGPVRIVPAQAVTVKRP